MSTILNSLSMLDQALEKLETVASRPIGQQDLFGQAGPSNGNKRISVVAGGNVIDAAILAKKLDTAIERVEQMLREG